MTPGSPPAPVACPDATALRRWTRWRGRQKAAGRARTGRGRLGLVGDAYVSVLSLAVAACLLVPLGGRLDVLDQGHPRGAEAPVPASTPGGLLAVAPEPSWLATAALLVVLSLAVGPASRVGPLFLRPYEAVWWLPLPGSRDGLLRPVARAETAVAGGAGALLGLVLGVVAGSGAVATLGWAGVWAALGCAAVTCLVAAQCRRASTVWLRGVLAVAAAGTLVVGALIPFPRTTASGPYLVAVAAALAGATLLTWWREVRPGLGGLHDATLLAAVARSLGAHVSLLSLDTRAVGRIVGPPPARPRRPSRLPLSAWASRRAWFPGWLRPVAAIAQADALLLLRRPGRLIQLAAGLAVALLPQLVPGTGGLARAAAYLCGAWAATHAVAEPARQAWYDRVPDSGWPVGPLLVGAAHLLVPAAAMVPWCCAAVLPVALAGPGGVSGWVLCCLGGAWVVLCPLGWAGAALRSGMRPAPDLTAGLVASPVGSLSPGAVQAVVAGSDAGVVAGLPAALAVAGWPLSPALVRAQAVATCAVVAWGLGTSLRAQG